MCASEIFQQLMEQQKLVGDLQQCNMHLDHHQHQRNQKTVWVLHVWVSNN